MTCDACPFSLFEAAEQAQNWGCLPSPCEIMKIKTETGKNWPCHEDENRICAGFVEACRETGTEYRGAPLASYKRWYQEGVA